MRFPNFQCSATLIIVRNWKAGHTTLLGGTLPSNENLQNQWDFFNQPQARVGLLYIEDYRMEECTSNQGAPWSMEREMKTGKIQLLPLLSIIFYQNDFHVIIQTLT